MYRYDTTFAFPVRGVPQTYKAYDAEMVIRNDADGKSYLYDLLDIEKKKVISAAPFSAETHSEVFAPKPSTNNISTSGEKVNGKFSLKGMDSAYLAAVERGDTEAAQNAKTAAGEGSGVKYSLKNTSRGVAVVVDNDILNDIDTTTSWAWDGKLKHPRTDNFVDFAHGDVLIQSGNNQYDADVIVGLTDTGESVFYDVVDIVPTQFQLKKESPTAVSVQKAFNAIQGDSSNSSISTSDGNVNAKFSMKGMDSAYLAAVERGDTEAAQNAKTAAGEGSGEGRFSIKRTSQMTLAQQLKMYYDGKMASSDAFYFGETPESLSAAGLDGIPLAMTIRSFKKSTKDKHNIPRRVLKSVVQDLNTAVFAFENGDRVGVLTRDIDADGKPLLIGIERNVQMDNGKVNEIRSMYGLDNPKEWIMNQIGNGYNFALLDEEKANAFLYPYGYSASRKEGIRSTDAIVEDSQSNVKGKFSLKGMDSAGRQLL